MKSNLEKGLSIFQEELNQAEVKRILQKLGRFDTKVWNKEGIIASLAGEFIQDTEESVVKAKKVAEGLTLILDNYSNPNYVMKDYKTLKNFFNPFVK